MKKTVVITGSTRGIGFNLSKAFLCRGWNVVICGRSLKTTNVRAQELQLAFPDASILGVACDVRTESDLQEVWDTTMKWFGTVDIWINNAGISNPRSPAWLLDAQTISDVLDTNLKGTILGSGVAIRGFLKQGFGALYNLEGLGSGRARGVQGLSIYSTTKAAIHHFNMALAEENVHPNIVVGALQPGMVLTDMVTTQYEGKPQEWQNDKPVLTALCNDVTKVANWLVEKMVANQRNGIRFAYSNTFRFMLKLPSLIKATRTRKNKNLGENP